MKPRNNWYVITGGPCAGKTSVIKILEEMGFSVQYEMARIYIDEQMAKGKTIEDIRGDEKAFQKKILKLKVSHEKKLPKKKLILFDRGIPDSDAYYEVAGISKNDRELKAALNNCSYKKVFFLELLDFQKDYCRTDQMRAKEIHASLEKSYKKMGIPFVKVPKMASKHERAKFIAKHLEAL